MFPNEKKRNFYVKWGSNLKIPRIAFSAVGFICIFAGIVLLTMSFNDPFYTNAYINGVATSVNGSFYISCFLLPFGLLYLMIGLVFFPVVEKGIHKGEYQYPVNNVIYSISDLYNDARFIDDRFIVRVYGNWMDVSFNWMNTKYFRGLGASSCNDVFTKMYRINNDRTYNELDLYTSINGDLNRRGVNLSKSFKCGRFRGRKFNMNFGYDETGFGPHIYTLDTLYITNYMHKWFADRGYVEKR
ncbi:hypothetical protein [Lachnospira multipara]|uniref:hypothetical protein n=1 Tax=Lachnospira multipara TaxID=28051 RepID=UPI0004216BE4|nr:hypothetical protein [Lachnospira multipara]